MSQSLISRSLRTTSCSVSQLRNRIWSALPGAIPIRGYHCMRVAKSIELTDDERTMGARRHARSNVCEVVFVKRGVLPENIGSDMNTTGRNASHGR